MTVKDDNRAADMRDRLVARSRRNQPTLTAKLGAIAGVVRADASPVRAATPPPEPSDVALAVLATQFTRNGRVCYSAADTNAGTVEVWRELLAAKYVELRNPPRLAGKSGHKFSVLLAERGRSYLNGKGEGA